MIPLGRGDPTMSNSQQLFGQKIKFLAVPATPFSSFLINAHMHVKEHFKNHPKKSPNL